MPGENYNNYLNGKQLSDKKTTGNPKKSLSFLWGIPVGILLAIIFLLSYKFLHLKYSDDTQTVDIVSTMDSYDYSAQNEKILALKAEIDMFRNALENRKCQGEPFEEEDPEPILEIPSEDTLPLPLTENLIEDDILTANLDIEKIPVAIPDVVPKETPKVIPKEPAKVTPKEVPKATPKETPKVAPKEPSKEAPKESAMPLVKKVSDLYGCWSNEPDYRVRKVSKNLLYVICFDRTGNAETYGARFDKNNKFLHDCKAKAKAKIVGTNIIITENLQVCPGWIAGVYNCLSNVPGTLACDFKVQDRIFAKTERYYYQPHLSSLRNMVRPK